MAKDALESEWILGLEDDALIEHELRESLDGITETRANIQTMEVDVARLKLEEIDGREVKVIPIWMP